MMVFSDAAVTSSAAVPVTVRDRLDRVVFDMLPSTDGWTGRTVGRVKVIEVVVGITLRHPEGAGAAGVAVVGIVGVISFELSVMFGVLIRMSVVAPGLASRKELF